MLKIANILTLGAFSSLKKKHSAPLRDITSDLKSKGRSLDLEDASSIEIGEVKARYCRLRITAYLIALAIVYTLVVFIRHLSGGAETFIYTAYSLLILIFLLQYYITLCYLGHVTRDIVVHWSERNSRKHTLRGFFAYVQKDLTPFLMPKIQ